MLTTIELTTSWNVKPSDFLKVKNPTLFKSDTPVSKNITEKLKNSHDANPKNTMKVKNDKNKIAKITGKAKTGQIDTKTSNFQPTEFSDRLSKLELPLKLDPILIRSKIIETKSVKIASKPISKSNSNSTSPISLKNTFTITQKPGNDLGKKTESHIVLVKKNPQNVRKTFKKNTRIKIVRQ
jgi:hypothetical protein